MTDGFTVDASELNKFAADLGEVPRVAGRYIRQAVEVSARNVKDGWKQEASDLAHAPAFPYSVTYDVKSFQGFGASVVEAEIGPDKDRPQGALGNLIEFGSINNPPQGLGHGALERVQDDFERGLSRALEDAERVAGVDSSVTASAAAVMRGSYQ